MFDGFDTESDSLVSYISSVRKMCESCPESFTICCVNVKYLALFAFHFNLLD